MLFTRSIFLCMLFSFRVFSPHYFNILFFDKLGFLHFYAISVILRELFPPIS